MYCQKCGAENSDQNKFCEKCGRPLNASASSMDVEKVKKTIFDESNPVWYKIVKGLVIGSAIVAFVAGLLSFFALAIDVDFLFGLTVLLSCWLGAAVVYVTSMVGLNYIKNVNTIREILEKKAE